MTFTFGDFELDEACRELRLGSRALPLQPRVFDLLALLIRNSDRVVGKDELLEALWPGVIVGDGSVQRAVSLARAALKQGGLEGAIRNYPRQGYRFCVDSKPSRAAEPYADVTGALSAAHQALEQHDWHAAIEWFLKADAERALRAADLERFAEACECSGRTHEAAPLLERAAAAFAAGGDSVGAGRSALRLAVIELDRGRIAVARGWLRHAARCLAGTKETWEHGLAAWITGRIAISDGSPEAAADGARTAVAIGRRVGSEDVVALGLLYQGHAELSLGRVEPGLSMIDEAAAMVIGGNISAWAGAVLYCALIWVCCSRGDWQRAAQWTEGFSRWCERHRLSQFSGLCQLHRAELLCISGRIADAEAVIADACETLARHSPWAEGDGYRILGELRLLAGELAGAEAAFRQAHKLGWDPQPGLAMLTAERGQLESALRGLTRAIDDTHWPLRHRRGLLLARLAFIAARAGDLRQARSALDALDAQPALWSSDSHAAAVAEARAELAAASGELPAAIAKGREAVRLWGSVTSGLSQALARLRLAHWLAEDGDAQTALLELDAAHGCFESMQAPARARECAALRRAIESRAARIMSDSRT